MLQRDRQRQRERGTAGGGGAGAFTAEYLVIAGGGGGASAYGGGGAGGYRTAADFSIALGSPYTVTVGAGAPADAAGGPLGSQGGDGGDSTFDAITSTGGGGGSSYDAATPGPLANGRDGGSGGGGGYTPAGSSGGSGNTPAVTPSQGNDGGGGSQSAPYYGAGGGGGAGAVGANGTSTNGGAGGAGLESFITGSSVYRAGGGGGGNYSANNGGAGGIGGGGNAGSAGVAGAAGAANTGGGGGGGHAGAAGVGAWTGGGAGGSGVVIIKVPGTVVAEFSAGVVYNYIPTDDFNVYEITAAGVSDTVTFSQGAVTTVGESLLFNDNDSAYLTRTPASAGDRKTWTWSGWVKRANIGTDQALLSCYFANNNADTFHLSFFNDNTLRVGLYSGYAMVTSQLFRDPSSWYHILFALDTTAATASERWKLYVNGKKVSSFSTESYPALNDSWAINAAQAHYHSYLNGLGWYADGYMSDVYFIDGEALDPSRFGKQDADGIWQPINYTGSYGTNGFHLEFADNSTAAALGTDTSGNGNDWTPSGITTVDQVTDTPSVNWPTFGLDRDAARVTLYDGNLQAFCSLQGIHRATFGVSSGKWYWEVYTYSAANLMTGIATAKANIASYLGVDTYGYAYFQDGRKFNVTSSSYGTTWGAGTIIGVAFDADNWTLEFFNNGTSQGVAFTGITPDIYFPAGGHSNGNGLWNFGQRPFAYTPPTGFQALNSSNLPAPTITDGKAHFAPALYTGNGTTQAIGGLEFQPDLVWIKNRDTAYSHWWQDAVRGAQKQLNSDTNTAENSYGNVLASFDTNGFTVNSSVGVNAAGQRHVAWNWNAGGSTVANTDGSIPSQVRANTDAGISIVSYTGTGAAATVGHGLTTAPSFIIAKNRDSATSWAVYSDELSISGYLLLNTTNAVATSTSVWQGVRPTSSVFSVNTSNLTNGSTHNIIAYCFAEVDGFSKFGSYTGNGSADGPFVYTGFRPAFVMVKCTTASGVGFDWIIHDTKRSSYNLSDTQLIANSSVIENRDSGGSSTAGFGWDILSNGFKLRDSSGGRNASGATYIYIAFAENPFKTARAR